MYVSVHVFAFTHVCKHTYMCIVHVSTRLFMPEDNLGVVSSEMPSLFYKTDSYTGLELAKEVGWLSDLIDLPVSVSPALDYKNASAHLFFVI